MNDFTGLIKIINCRYFELLPVHPAHHPIEAFGEHPLKCQMNVVSRQRLCFKFVRNINAHVFRIGLTLF